MKVKMGLNDMDFESLATYGASVHSGMSANAAIFDTPNPALTVLNAGVLDVRAKIQAKKDADAAALRATQELYASVANLKGLLTQEASYVENKANKDATVITKANMGVRAQPSAAGPMPKVQNLKLTTSDHAGAVDWMCAPVKGAGAYVVQLCTGDPSVEANWHYGDVSIRSSGTLTGQAPGKIWVRVQAKGADEQVGPPSDPAVEMVR